MFKFKSDIPVAEVDSLIKKSSKCSQSVSPNHFLIALCMVKTQFFHIWWYFCELHLATVHMKDVTMAIES